MNSILTNQNHNCKENSSDSQLKLAISDSELKPVFMNFEGGDLSSDAWVLVLKEVGQQIGLTEKMVKALPDSRDQRYINPTYLELLPQHIAQIAYGYEAANDCNQVRSDPIFKMSRENTPKVTMI